jgi:hypothetical protein
VDGGRERTKCAEGERESGGIVSSEGEGDGYGGIEMESGGIMRMKRWIRKRERKERNREDVRERVSDRIVRCEVRYDEKIDIVGWDGMGWDGMGWRQISYCYVGWYGEMDPHGIWDASTLFLPCRSFAVPDIFLDSISLKKLKFYFWTQFWFWHW